MATIIQPYNPWREQLAANIIVPFVSDMIKKNQERADNRLRNEAIQKMISMDGAMNDYMTPDMVLPELPKMGGELAPYQKTFEGLAKENSINPSAVQTAGTNNGSYLTNLANVLGDRRYSGLDTATVMQMAQPYIAEQERAKREARLAEMANAFTGAEGDAAKQNALWGGVLNGLADPALLGAMQKQYEYNNPYMQRVTTDLGGNVMAENWNPRTGETAGSTLYPKTLDPNAAARNALDWANYELNRDKFGEDIRRFDWTTQNGGGNGAEVQAQRNAALALIKDRLTAISKERAVLTESYGSPGLLEEEKKNIAARLQSLEAEELRLKDEYKGLLPLIYGQQGEYAESSQDENFNALPDAWQKKANEWRRKGYDIQVHWYGENQCQIFAANPRDRDSMTQINKGSENIKRVNRKPPETPESIIAATAADENGQTSPEAVAAVAEAVTQKPNAQGPQTGRTVRFQGENVTIPYLAPVSGDVAPKVPAQTQSGGDTITMEQYKKLLTKYTPEQAAKMMADANVTLAK